MPAAAVAAALALATLLICRLFDDAIKVYWALLRLDAGDPNTHNNLGNALAACGRSDEAIQEFQEAVRLKPASPAVLCNLAVVWPQKIGLPTPGYITAGR